MKPNFKILDGLRGIAATYVLINHSRGHLLAGGNDYAKIIPISQWSMWDKIYYSLLQLTSLGRESVILFFILSGFSIAYSLQKKIILTDFYKRRIIRLYPPYIMALIWAELVFQISNKITPLNNVGMMSVFESTHHTFNNLFYNPFGDLIGQFWSLTHEVIFYLLIPFFILKRRFYYIISITFYISSLFISLKETSGTNIVTLYVFDYNIYFAIGVWLMHNFKEIEKKIICYNKTLFYLTTGSVIIFMIIIKFMTSEYNKFSIALCAIFSIFVIINFLYHKIEYPLLSYLGSFSYTLYITHISSVFLFKSLLFKAGVIPELKISIWYIWILGVFFGILLAKLLYYIAEYPSKLYLMKSRT